MTIKDIKYRKFDFFITLVATIFLIWANYEIFVKHDSIIGAFVMYILLMFSIISLYNLSIVLWSGKLTEDNILIIINMFSDKNNKPAISRKVDKEIYNELLILTASDKISYTYDIAFYIKQIILRSNPDYNNSLIKLIKSFKKIRNLKIGGDSIKDPSK